MSQSAPKAILHLNLRKEFFDRIAAGKKSEEFRDRTEYWKSRLEGREYDEIEFRYGYATKAPTMRVKFLGVTKTRSQYIVRLGKILSKKNFK